MVGNFANPPAFGKIYKRPEDDIHIRDCRPLELFRYSTDVPLCQSVDVPRRHDEYQASSIIYERLGIETIKSLADLGCIVAYWPHLRLTIPLARPNAFYGLGAWYEGFVQSPMEQPGVCHKEGVFDFARQTKSRPRVAHS